MSLIAPLPWRTAASATPGERLAVAAELESLLTAEGENWDTAVRVVTSATYALNGAELGKLILAVVRRLKGAGDGCPLPDCQVARLRGDGGDDPGGTDAAPERRELPGAAERPAPAGAAAPGRGAGSLFADAG